jgi:hypothetical protein
MLALLLLLALPYWEAKEAKDWTEVELDDMGRQSPWAREEGFLATAKPMREAEAEWKRRHVARKGKVEAADLLEDDYQEFLRRNGATHVVFAVRIYRQQDLADEKEIKVMEKECYLKNGKQKLKLAGHFPPNSNDPYLRMIFPRPEKIEKTLKLLLYMPGVDKPYRELEFFPKEMMYKGKLEY